MIRQMDEIETAHLRLVPLQLPDAAAMLEGRRPVGARWAPGYPTDITLVAAGLVVRAEEERRDVGPFRLFQMVRRQGDLVIGDCGFLAPPDRTGTVHIGFGLAEVERGHRLAGEALRALVAWALERPDVERVVADAARTNIASIRVMERAGMHRVGEDEDLVYYESR